MQDEGQSYKVLVNGFEFTITDKELSAVNFSHINAEEIHLIKDHRSFSARIEKSDSAKKLKLVSAGTNFEILIKDPLDQRLEKMGFAAANNKQLKDIKAPMPGLVLSVSVKEGQEVKEGDKLLILEAMKMENSIIIHSSAKIKRVAVNPGQAVDKGQVLVELE